MSLRLLIPLLALGLAAAAPVTTIVDGDTFVLGGERVRLWGVDAPEGRQVCLDSQDRSFRCGARARSVLQALIGRRAVTCLEKDRDAYGRLVGQCRAGTTDLGKAMVSAGWAVEYRQYSGGAYAATEAEARAAKRGLWAGTFEKPDQWRAKARAERPPPPGPPGACAINGNINPKGRRIFHSPGQRDYATTAIDEARGERWFCSAAEATAAGWTPAQR